MSRRLCSRTACSGRATTTLTYDYRGQVAVLGPLAPVRTPGTHDLCRLHGERTSAPRGWEMVRLPDLDTAPLPPEDDWLALADAIREVGLRHDEVTPAPAPTDLGESVVVLAEKGHLRVIADR